MDPARIVFVGDLHLGRRPSALPADLAEIGLGASALGPAEVWRRTVRLAIEGEAHAVVLAGDVVDREDDRFGAGRVLRTGVAELVEAGIPVFSVVGNHDVTALPRVADAIEQFRLLGRGGEWERVRIERDGVVPCQLVGWSFPTARVAESPLGDLRRDLVDDSIATLGVLHCDLDASSGGYAPVRSAELEETGFDAWLLGHIHKPADLAARPFGYLGSMTGLDAGEPGPRGPWWVEVEGPGRVNARHVPLAPLRYETFDCALAGLRVDDREDTADDFDGLIREGLEELHRRLEAEEAIGAGRAGVVVCRVRVRGPERHLASVRDVLFQDRFLMTHSIGGVHYAVERVVEDARPDLDLDRLAQRHDAPGQLARRLVDLRDGNPTARPFLARVRAALDDEMAGGRFSQLDPPAWELEDDDARGGQQGGQKGEQALVDLLLRAGTRELEGLIAQKPDSFPSQSPLAGEGGELAP